MESNEDKRPLGEAQPTRAFIITKFMMKNFGFLVTQLMTAYIDTMPESTVSMHEIDKGLIWFKPQHNRLMKRLQFNVGLYWKAVVNAINFHLLQRTTHKGEQWYAIDFQFIEALVDGINMEEEEANAIAEIAKLEAQLSAEQQSGEPSVTT